MTFAELLDGYLRTLHGRASHENVARCCAMARAQWATHPTKASLRAWLRTQAHAPAQANKVLGVIRAAYNWAAQEAGWEGGNPAQGLRGHRQATRSRVLTAWELRSLLQAREFCSPSFQRLLLVLLTTGCRLSEALSMRQVHVDYTRGIWTKPSTKNGVPQVLPLPRCTQAELRQVSTAWLFPGRGGGHLTVAAAEKAWRALRTMVRLPDIRLHDLRRTVATRLYEAGEPELLVKSILHHLQTTVTAVYIRPSLDRQAAALERHAETLMALSRASSIFHPQEVSDAQFPPSSQLVLPGALTDLAPGLRSASPRQHPGGGRG